MKSTGMNKLTGLGAVSIAVLCLVWSGLSNAGSPGSPGSTNYTTMSRASVKIQSFEQTGEGETQRVTVRTDDAINYLLDEEPGTKVPGNLQLVLLNYCDRPDGGSLLTVWDKDAEKFASEGACLFNSNPGIFDDDNNVIYQALNPDPFPFMMDRMGVDVRMKLRRVKRTLIEERPYCLEGFSTMAMSGHYNGAGDSRVMRTSGSIKTHGKVFEVFEGNIVFCE